MFTKRDRNEIRKIRHERVRKKISGTPEMPRLSVYRSLNNIYVQVIDDVAGKTLVSCSTLDPQIKGQLSELDKKGAGKLVGKTVVAILNLPNRKMMGEDSCGMLISAVHEHDGKEQLHLLMLDDNIPAGFRLC